MKLSKRMRALASLVSKGNRLADVGTDHAYIPIALVKEGSIPRAIAMDVSQGPLARAKAHIRESGLSTYIDTRLSDGLSKLAAGEADTVLIAGMGGMLMVRILAEGGHCLGTVEELILQPQSDIHRVRMWLAEHGFRIASEDLVMEDGKYYPMFRAVHGQEEALSEAEQHYGKVSVQRSQEVLHSFLLDQLAKNKKIEEKLLKNGGEDSARMAEVKRQAEWTALSLQEVKRNKRQEEGMIYEVQ